MPEFAKRMEYMAGSAAIIRGLFGAMNMPEGTKWVFPDGGLFSWVELPKNIDTTELLKEAANYKVAFIAGAGFFVGKTGEGKNCMRISFGNVTPERIEEGMKRLGDLIKSKLS